MYLVLELANNGTLYERLQAQPGRKLEEKAAALLIKQLCLALAYCHARGVIHRDIKPENILLHKGADGVEVLKLADFGWTVAQRSTARRHTLCGTTEYLPPEVVAGVPYGVGFDSWCLGVLVYEMLMGASPFAAGDSEGVMQRIAQGSFSLPRKAVSPPAGDLIRALLVHDAEGRLTPAQVLEHPWITGLT